MKKLSAILVTAILASSLTACGSANTDNNNGQQSSGTGAASSQPANDQAAAQDTPAITADEALDIALEQAGVTKDSIRDLENRLERENGILVYEIDFDSGSIEYSYDVNAKTGDIIERDRDRND